MLETFKKYDFWAFGKIQQIIKFGSHPDVRKTSKQTKRKKENTTYIYIYIERERHIYMYIYIYTHAHTFQVFATRSARFLARFSPHSVQFYWGRSNSSWTMFQISFRLEMLLDLGKRLLVNIRQYSGFERFFFFYQNCIFLRFAFSYAQKLKVVETFSFRSTFWCEHVGFPAV